MACVIACALSPDATAEKPNKLIVCMHPSASPNNAPGTNDTIETMAPMFLKHGYALVVFTQKNYTGWNDSDGEKLFVDTGEDWANPGHRCQEADLFGLYAAGGQMARNWSLNDPRV